METDRPGNKLAVGERPRNTSKIFFVLAFGRCIHTYTYCYILHNNIQTTCAFSAELLVCHCTEMRLSRGDSSQVSRSPDVSESSALEALTHCFL